MSDLSKQKEPREPQDAEDWQAAVDAANGVLVIHMAKEAKLITGGPKINVERCMELLVRGAKLGFEPNREAVRVVAEGYSSPEDHEALATIALGIHDELQRTVSDRVKLTVLDGSARP